MLCLAVLMLALSGAAESSESAGSMADTVMKAMTDAAETAKAAIEQHADDSAEVEVVVSEDDEQNPVLGTAMDGAVVIRKSDVADTYDKMLSYYVQMYNQYGMTVDEYDTDFQKNVAEYVVQNAAAMEIMKAYAAEQGYVLTEERKAEIAEAVAGQLAEIRANYEMYLSSYGISGEELEKIVEDELAEAGYSEAALVESEELNDMLTYVHDLAVRDITVTDEEVKEAFDKKVAEQQERYSNVDYYSYDFLNDAEILYTPAGLRGIQFIYIVSDAAEATGAEATAEEATAEEAAAEEATAEEATDAEAAGTVDIAELTGLAKAEAVLAAIRGGMPFEEAMLAYNEDTVTEDQMKAGYPISENTTFYGDELRDAAMALENVGDISDILTTEYGYFIVRYDRDFEEGIADFEARKEQETAEALTAKQEEAYQNTVNSAVEAGNVQIVTVDPLLHVYVGESIEVVVAYGQTAAETQLTDAPAGKEVAALAAGASVEVLGKVTVEGTEYTFVSVPGTEMRGYVKSSEITTLDQESALAVDNSTLATAAEADADALPIFSLVMNDGNVIYGELYPEIAPESVGNFTELANTGFYDGLIFHRVIAGFMIQGGDPLGNGTGDPGYSIRGEFSNNGVENTLSHTRGVLSMARSAEYDSAGSQFFIMHADGNFLDGDYAAFGAVLGGMEEVDVIASVPTNSSDKPMTDQVIRTIYVETHGNTYPFTKIVD